MDTSYIQMLVSMLGQVYLPKNTNIWKEIKLKIIHHPITYVSGLFRGPQINWAALTKEAYAIYMSVK